MTSDYDEVMLTNAIRDCATCLDEIGQLKSVVDIELQQVTQIPTGALAAMFQDPLAGYWVYSRLGSVWLVIRNYNDSAVGFFVVSWGS